MTYQDFLKVAKEYSTLFEYGFSANSMRSKMFWSSVIAFFGMLFFGFSHIIKSTAFIPDSYAFPGMLIFEAAFIMLYILHIERQKKAKLVALGLYRSDKDQEQLPIEIRGRWLSTRLPVQRERYLELVDAFEKLDARLRKRHEKISIIDIYMRGIFNWTLKAKSVAVILFIPIAISTVQAVLEDKPWTKPLKLNMTTENLQTGGFLLVILIVFSVVFVLFASLVRLLFNYWLDVVTAHGCSDASINRLASDLLRLSTFSIDVSEGPAETQLDLKL